jgi:hypothetical protein
MLTRFVLPSALVLSLVVPGAQTQKSLIVTVLDSSGAPVKDVAAGDLTVLEDGATREVVSVAPATDPMTVAILVDNTKPSIGKNAPTQELRAALNGFVKTIQGANPQSQIGLWEFAGAGVMIQKPTAKTEDLTKRINRMFPGQVPGGVMLEALVDASRELSKKGIGPRRIILGVSFDSAETSAIETREVANAMHKAGVSFWAVTSVGSGAASTREVILDRITAASGGLRLSGVTAISLETQVKSIADALTSQYIVTYARPAGAPDSVTSIQAAAKKGHRVLTAPWAQ